MPIQTSPSRNGFHGFQTPPETNPEWSGLVDDRGRPLTSRQATYGDFALPHVLTFSSIIGTAYRTYREMHDEAMRRGRDEAKAMERDCYLMGLMRERRLAVASRPWKVEVDNEKDIWQKMVKDGLTKIVKAIPKFNRMRLYLQWATWYGRYGSQLIWEWKDLPLPLPTTGRTAQTKPQRAMTIKAHQPVHGDKIKYLWDGTPIILVNGGEGAALPGSETVIGDFSRALTLKGTWRQRFVVHQHECMDSDFFDAETASAINGIGVRHFIYWWNWMRTEWISWLSDFIERAGIGVRLWKYRSGDPTSKAEVQEAAEKHSKKLNILVPVIGEGPNHAEGMEFVDTTMNGAQFLMDLVKMLDGYIERFIVGQHMSSGDDAQNSMGGTGRADFARDTKSQIINWDSEIEMETLTDDILVPICRWTYPWVDFPVRLVGDKEPTDPKETMGAVKEAVDLGADFRIDDVIGLTGLEPPQDGDRTLSQARQEMQAAMQPQPGQPMPGQPGQPGDPAAAGQPGMDQGAGAPPVNPDQQPLGFSRRGEPERFDFDDSKHPRGDAGRFKAKLEGMEHGQLGRVGGWMTRRTGPKSWRIDTDDGHIEGDHDAIKRHIERHEGLAQLEGRKYADAMARGEGAQEADPFVDKARAEREQWAFAQLPHGARVVSLHPETHGRIGTIQKTMAGVKVKLDNEPGEASTHIEPLDEKQSWRPKATGKATSKAKATVQELRNATPKPERKQLFDQIEEEVQGNLFGGEPSARQGKLFARGEPDRYAAHHAPKGGITVAGTFYRGGRFIPSSEVDKDPEAKSILEGHKAARQATLRDHGAATHEILNDHIDAHAAHATNLGDGHLASARRAYRSLKSYHGDLWKHRVHELAKADVATLHAGGKDAERAHRRLQAYRQMLQWQGMEDAKASASHGRLDRILQGDLAREGHEAAKRPEYERQQRASRHGTIDVPTSQLHVDPERFQYKLKLDKTTGTGEELKSVKKFRPEFAGTILAWHDPEADKTFVVNGHHRYELARRTNHPKMSVFFIHAKDAKQARAIGALANIAEGRGTAVDAAKFMRDTGLTVDGIAKEGISLKGQLADQAVALSAVSDSIFRKVIDEKIKPNWAVSIGRLVPEHDVQNQLVGFIEKSEAAGKKVNDDVVEEMAKEIAETPTTTEADPMAALFGDDGGGGIIKSVFLERCQLKTHVRNTLAAEANAFKAVSTERKAGTLKRGENILNVERNKEISAESSRLKNIFDALANYKGELSSVINQHASELSAEPRRRKEIMASALEQSRAILQRTLTGERGVA